MSAPAAKASIAASTRLGSWSRPPARAPSTKALEAITPNRIACPTPRRYPLIMCATHEIRDKPSPSSTSLYGRTRRLPRQSRFETADDRARPTRARVARSQNAGCRLRCVPQRLSHRPGPHAGITYPRVPGHEVIGMVEAIGPDVLGWDVGMRVGVSVGSVVRAGTAPAAAAVRRSRARQ